MKIIFADESVYFTEPGYLYRFTKNPTKRTIFFEKKNVITGNVSCVNLFQIPYKHDNFDKLFTNLNETLCSEANILIIQDIYNVTE